MALQGEYGWGKTIRVTRYCSAFPFESCAESAVRFAIGQERGVVRGENVSIGAPVYSRTGSCLGPGRIQTCYAVCNGSFDVTSSTYFTSSPPPENRAS
jgi:hypothetical protein